jgi:hypothetical protein
VCSLCICDCSNDYAIQDSRQSATLPAQGSIILTDTGGDSNPGSGIDGYTPPLSSVQMGRAFLHLFRKMMTEILRMVLGPDTMSS